MPDSDDDKTVVLGGTAKPLPATRSAGKKKIRSNNALPIGTCLSEFEIVDLVGEGGFGIVYLAEDHSLKRRVAIKEYMPSSLAERGEDSSVVVRSERHTDTFEVGRRSFVNEALLLAQFDHQALVKVYRFWEANGTAYMAMPFYAGKTLREVLKERSEPPDERWLRKVLMPLMDALELIHAENCFHRDVAPDNIMILRDERPVLLDFGAARRVISDMTQALTVILKPGFAPIEQYADMPGVKQGPWTDIYALAAVIYFIIVGRTPPPSVNRMMQDSYEPLTVVAAGRYSDRLLRGIDQCLAVRAEDRPQSIREMRQLLGFDLELAPTQIDMLEETSIVSPVSAKRHDGEPADDQHPAAAPVPTSTLIAPQSTTASPFPAPEPEVPAAQPAFEQAPAGRTRFGKAHYLAGAVGAALLAAAFFLIFGRSSKDAPEAGSPPAEVQAPVSRPAVAPAAVLRQPVTLEQALTTIAAASDNSFELSVEGVRTPLTIGRDPLSFMLHSRRGGYLYVLLADTATARLSLLFPNDLDRDNRVVAGEPVVFPRSTWAYEADLPQGSWQVLALVSASPRRFTLLQAERTNGIPAAPVDLVEARLNESAGGEVALLGEADCPAGQSCSSGYAAVRFTVEETTAGTRRPGSAASAGKGRAATDDAARSGHGGKDAAPELSKMLDEMLKAK